MRVRSSNIVCPEKLASVFTDGLEHPESWVLPRRFPTEHAVVDEACQRVQVAVGDSDRCLERYVTGKDGEPRQESPLGGAQQRGAPVKGVAKCLLTCRQIVGSSGQQGEALAESVEQLPWRQRVRSRGCQLDRKWQPIQAAADLPHVRIIGKHRRPRVQRTGAGNEETGRSALL